LNIFGTTASTPAPPAPPARDAPGIIARLLTRFLEANRRLSQRFDPRVESTERFYRDYDALVVGAARSLEPGSAIVDLGGGRHCPFASEVDRSRGTHIIAVDVSPSELEANETVDEVRVADVAEGLPFADGEISLLVSRTLLEHVKGVPAAVGHIARVVAPGGRTIHLIPCRNALFALAARAIPWRIAKPALDRLVPSAKGVVEFEPYYDNCEPHRLEQLFREAGFSSVRVQVCWGQTGYFEAFFPLFLAVWGYQASMRLLGIRRFAAYAIVDAVRSAA
jgi:ubiquinone/menaquinone biosynthesis C-methylase UbiE